jgi:hypothetical protein
MIRIGFVFIAANKAGFDAQLDLHRRAGVLSRAVYQGCARLLPPAAIRVAVRDAAQNWLAIRQNANYLTAQKVFLGFKIFYLGALRMA